MKDVRFDKKHSVMKVQPVIKGDHISIDSFFYSTSKIIIGSYVHIGPHVSVIGGVDSLLTLGDFTHLSAGSRIICASDTHSDGLTIPWVPDHYRNLINEPVTVERFAGVCTNAIVFPGVTIAEGSVVGAGCVVRHDTEPWMIYVGSNPRKLKERPREKIIQYAREMGFDYS